MGNKKITLQLFPTLVVNTVKNTVKYCKNTIKRCGTPDPVFIRHWMARTSPASFG
jgi:cyclophilin family peptidyl-prolyl cis-trans isomerase